MASAGPNSPGTAANDASFGSNAWSSISNITTSNNARAGAFLSSGTTSQYAKATNFGFALPSATIDGIVVEVERRETDAGGDIIDARVRIVKGGTIGSTDKASATEWPTTDAYATYGGASDLWGETWTSSDINASTFGVVIALQGNAFFTGQIDHIRITVYYTESASLLTRLALLGVG